MIYTKGFNFLLLILITLSTLFTLTARSDNDDDTSPPSEYPAVPTLLKATAGDRQVTLRWESTGYKTLQYRLEYAEATATTYTRHVYTQFGALSDTIKGLTNGTTYKFRVRGLNTMFFGNPSNELTARPLKLPGTPRNVTAKNGNGTASISWDAPTDIGGGIDNYEYRIDINNDGSYNDWQDHSANSTVLTLTLENGRDYAVQIRAVNSTGSSTETTAVIVSPRQPDILTPSPPRNLEATAGNGQAVLSWQEPATAGGIIDYEYRYFSDNDAYSGIWKFTSSTSTTHTVTDLINDKAYVFEVRARNGAGAGRSSSLVYVTPNNRAAPSAPQNLAAYPTNTKVLLYWGAPQNNGNTPILEYQYRYKQQGGSWSLWQENSTDFTVSVTSLTNDTEYTFEVRARNRVGTGTPATTTATPTPTILWAPNRPTNLRAIASNTAGAIDLSWTAPENNGSPPIIRYEYKYRIYNDNTWGAWSRWTSTSSTTTSCTVTGLTSRLKYRFRVRAVNLIDHGRGAKKAEAIAP